MKALITPALRHLKGKKDLEQAHQLMNVLLAQRPGDLLLAWDALKQRGSGWVKPVASALKSLATTDKKCVQTLCDLIELKLPR